jgi:predicted RNA-binding Zn ribbon-like protein
MPQELHPLTDDHHGDDFELTAGALCLDLANTVSDRPTTPRERLRSYADLLRWSRLAGVVSARGEASLGALARARPRRAARVLERAVALREAVYRIFSALARDEAPPAGDLSRLNEELRRGLARQRLDREQGRFVWAWDDSPDALDRMLWGVARSAAELLVSDEAGTVRECAAQTCGWLFVDRSRSRRRKWCDMAVCGNREKAKRHYHRRRRRGAARD